MNTIFVATSVLVFKLVSRGFCLVISTMPSKYNYENKKMSPHYDIKAIIG